MKKTMRHSVETVEQSALFDGAPRPLRSGLVRIEKVSFDAEHLPEEKAAKELAARLPEELLKHEFAVTLNGTLIHEHELFAAIKRRGVREVRVMVLSEEKLDAVVKRSLDELGKRLSYLERCEMVLRGQEAYEARYPHTRRGGYDRSATGEAQRQKHKRKKSVYGESPYSLIAAQAFHLRQRTIQHDIHIAKALDRVVRDSIRGLQIARRKHELTLLARMSVAEQTATVAYINEKGASFNQAVSAMGLAEPEPEKEMARALRRLLRVAADNPGWLEHVSHETVAKALESFREESAEIMATLNDIILYYSSRAEAAEVESSEPRRIAA